MKVQETMSADVCIANPDQPISDAAKMMAEYDCGALPVGENDKLVGMIIDRDIAIRAIGKGKGPNTAIREVMSEGVCYCFDDQDISEVAANMSDVQVRRLPVLNRQKRVVGMISLGDIAKSDGQACAQALRGVAEPGGQHTQVM
jgi:CBS domain-containing protein